MKLQVNTNGAWKTILSGLDAQQVERAKAAAAVLAEISAVIEHKPTTWRLVSEGDFGSPGDRTLKDKIVTGRSKSTCVECLSTTQQGERCRVLTAIFDGEMRTYRWCSACCAAFVALQDDDYGSMDERAAIRAKGGDHG